MYNYYDLECRYDARNCFYGKAKVEMVDLRGTKGELCSQLIKLYSYNTLVAEIEKNFEKNEIIYKYFGKYSQTTTRHQKEFFKQENLSDKEIKTLFKDGKLVKQF